MRNDNDVALIVDCRPGEIKGLILHNIHYAQSWSVSGAAAGISTIVALEERPWPEQSALNLGD